MAMISCSDVPCSSLAAFGGDADQRCSFNEDSDIAGIGVLLSFIIYGAVTFLISAYIFFFVTDGFASELTNTLDQKVVETTKSLTQMLRKGPEALPVEYAQSRALHWTTSFKHTLADSDTLSQIVVMLSDQQLVLGFSMLIVGYVKFVTMTEYHFAIVSALSNISFVVHVSTIPVVVRAMFDKDKADAKWYNFKRLWRAIAKIVFDILLFISFVPTGNSWWLANYGLPTYCIWRNTKGNYNGVSTRTMIADMVLLCWGVAYELHAFFPIFAEDASASRLLECAVSVLLVPRHLHSWTQSKAEKPTSPLLRYVVHLLQWILWAVIVLGHVDQQ
ncbi:hypothetical protein LTR36_001684 [Oleoguttula mirabilis]|uniref:Uncharacterized protein n=1 Tax=Oleoguttula mirabilis TaxID=1507867 RepID=A0AAV9JNK8_9PEZI|nr:hypothetical protein LTR36_001684 [Oleoguttula mirabilis]